VPLGETLPSDRATVGLVEAWRGELIHWITTDRGGKIQRYAIKDPSFNNWTGLAIAVRGNLVADFPLCNKSFNLSYSGNDL
jgi:Ni,Fe-hydrogenase III large subunit